MTVFMDGGEVYCGIYSLLPAGEPQEVYVYIQDIKAVSCRTPRLPVLVPEGLVCSKNHSKEKKGPSSAPKQPFPLSTCHILPPFTPTGTQVLAGYSRIICGSPDPSILHFGPRAKNVFKAHFLTFYDVVRQNTNGLTLHTPLSRPLFQ